MNRKITLTPKNIFDFIFNEERRSSIFILVAAAAALFIANSSWADTYFSFFNYHLSLGPVDLSIQHWINEGLMALFFLVVGLEVKREFIDGELRTWRKAAFPVFAAIGGMLVPALLFSLLNPYSPQSAGWAIPMATDIAIAIGVIGILGSRIPRSLKIFLLTLAIVDDLGSIIIISLFYSQPTNMFALVLALIMALGLAMVRKRKNWFLLFIIFGFALWYCLLLAGVSATLAGVIVALLMPLTSTDNTGRLQAPEIIEDKLIPLTSFIIVPLFVFANSGITFSKISLTANGSMSIFIGVLLGLVIGKPVGILLASWLGHVTKITEKPMSISWSQLLGLGFVAGIGFTISILITSLAYEDSVIFQNAATVGIFLASLISGIIGLTVLSLSLKKRS